MILVDAGYFLAIAHRRDSLHQRARAWAKVVAEPLVVTEYTLWETVNRLSQPIDRPKAHRLLAQLQSNRQYEIVPASAALWQAGLDLHRQRPDKEWSLTDCMSFVVMQERGITRALTHDHHFEQAGFEALLRRDPP